MMIAVDDDAVLEVQGIRGVKEFRICRKRTASWSDEGRTKRQCGLMVQVRTGRGSGVCQPPNLKQERERIESRADQCAQ